MSDFDARSRRAAAAMRREAEAITDTDAVLAHIQEGNNATTIEPRDGRRWRRPLMAASALAVGTAAALIGVAVLVNDGDAVVEPPATETDVPTTPAAPTPPTVLDTTPPSTVPVTAPPSTGGPPSTDAPPTTRPEDWVPTQPAPPEPPAGGRVPYVIASQVSDSDRRYRGDDQWRLDVEPAVYVQAFGNADGSQWLYVVTGPRPDVIVEPIRGTIGPWTDLFAGGGVFNGLDIATDDIVVRINTNADGVDLRRFAARIGPRPDGDPGWEIAGPPEGFEPVGEGYWWSGDSRLDVVTDAQGQPRSEVAAWFGTEGGGAFVSPYYDLATTRLVDVDGTPGLFIEPDSDPAGPGLATLQWELEPGLYVRLTVAGEWTPDELIDHAGAVVEPQTRQFWEQQPILPTEGGCQAFFC